MRAIIKLPNYTKDHLGSIRITIDENGEVVSAQDYYPYGEIIANRSYLSGGIVNDKYKFTEKERDTETNYDYFGAGMEFTPMKIGDSELGRWLLVDPLVDKYPGCLPTVVKKTNEGSPYNYTLNNPLRFIDPDGRVINKAIKHFLTVIFNVREAYRGASLIAGGTIYAPLSGGTSTIGIALGIEYFANAVIEADLYTWNSSVETYKSITGNEDVQKAPEGMFELIASQIDGVTKAQNKISWSDKDRLKKLFFLFLKL